ncbi:MAG TPA: hypothetical protein QF458_04855, partial [Candidatus Woesearchaeota archaeon]|nr:hypothetical protein [Candidatus Woesearchaeota archaeon]
DLIIFYTVLMIFEIIMRKLISPASKDSGMEDAGIGDTGLGDAGMEGTGMGNIGKGFGKI